MGVARPTVTQKQRDSDEENLREECSSTESTHQDMRTPHNLQNGDKETQVRASPPVQMVFVVVVVVVVVIQFLMFILKHSTYIYPSY